MHGVGHQWVRRSFQAFGLPTLVAVPCQAEPDPEFPTVAFPNPEEKGVRWITRVYHGAWYCAMLAIN